MGFKKQILFLLSLFAVQFAFAQSGANVKASVSKNKFLIGEPIQLTIEAKFPIGAVNSFIRVDSIDHFELSGKPVIDSSNSDGTTTIKGIYTITSFDSGHWVIPSFVLSPGIVTDTIPIDVIFSDFDPNQDYHDIKDIIEVTPTKKKQWWWYVAGGALLLLAILYLALRKKKPTTIVAPKTVVNPYDEAMRQLMVLKNEKTDAKTYHSKLTDIFRLYIFRRKGILSLQKTTDDLVLQLNKLGLDKDLFIKLSQSLQLSDFVKFAKYDPSADDNNNAFETIKISIEEIEKHNAV